MLLDAKMLYSLYSSIADSVEYLFVTPLAASKTERLAFASTPAYVLIDV